MADVKERLPENVEGPYFITSECIDCKLCRELLPDVFFEVEGRHFVGRQPKNEREREIAEEAIESCPTESIGLLSP